MDQCSVSYSVGSLWNGFRVATACQFFVRHYSDLFSEEMAYRVARKKNPNFGWAEVARKKKPKNRRAKKTPFLMWTGSQEEIRGRQGATAGRRVKKTPKTGAQKKPHFWCGRVPRRREGGGRAPRRVGAQKKPQKPARKKNPKNRRAKKTPKSILAVFR